jgi:hypothetical protein
MNVEFELRIKDITQGTLRNVKFNTNDVFNNIDKHVVSSQKGLNDLGKGVKIDVDVSGLTNANREVERLSRSMKELPGAGGVGGGMSMGKFATGAFYGNLASQAVMMAGRDIFEKGKQGLSFGMDMERNIVGLGTFVGEKNARNIIDRITREGVYTPYTTGQLLPVERGLIPQGLSPDRAHRDTWALANAVAASGGGEFELQRMGWHMQQAAGMGKIDGRGLREFAMAGIPITRLLQNSIPGLKGMSQAKAMEKLDNMTISYDMVSNALFKASQKGGMFAGAMDKLSQTIPGKWSTFVDKMQIGAWRITDMQEKNITNFEDRLIGFADKFPGMAADMAGDFNTAFKRMEMLMPKFQQTGGDIGNLLKPLKDVLLSKELTEFVGKLSDMGHTAAFEVSPQIKKLGDMASWAIDKIGNELNYYQKGWDLWQRTRPFYRKKEESGSGLRNVMATVGNIRHDLSVVTFGLIKDNAVTTLNGKDPKTWSRMFPKPNSFEGIGSWMAGGNPLPYTPKEDKRKSNPGSDKQMQSNSDAIIGGGSKQIIIKIERFVDHIDYHAVQAQGKDGMAVMKSDFTRMFLEVLDSARAAM